MPDRRHLRDAARLCPAVFDYPTDAIMQCQLAPGHDGLHAYECTRWSDAHNRRAPRKEGSDARPR